MAIHHKVWNSYWSDNGNRDHNFSWNKRNISTVSHTHTLTHRKCRFLNDLLLISVASLLTCLHQLRSENVRLEEHVNNLVARRDHLLAVNARLALPLNPLPQSSSNSNPGNIQHSFGRSMSCHNNLYIFFSFHFSAAPFNTNLHMNGTNEPSSKRSHHLK